MNSFKALTLISTLMMGGVVKAENLQGVNNRNAETVLKELAKHGAEKKKGKYVEEKSNGICRVASCNEGEMLCTAPDVVAGETVVFRATPTDDNGITIRSVYKPFSEFKYSGEDAKKAVKAVRHVCSQ